MEDQKGDVMDPQNRPGDHNDSLQQGTRRSGRIRKAPVKFEEEYIPSPHETRNNKASNGSINEGPDGASDAAAMDDSNASNLAVKQTRPKRKAGQAVSSQKERSFSIKENMTPQEIYEYQMEVFRPMNDEERKTFKGWAELESDPALFNTNLRRLGVKDVKIQEVVGLDEMSMLDLPHPVHGLIFLYSWNDDDESDENRVDCPDDLWFANQTMNNGCATVALMNIIMNADVELGPELRQFKQQTQSRPPPHRGYFLDINDFIRTIHNSRARRIDLLKEDVKFVEQCQEWEKEWEKEEKLKKSGKTPKKASTTTKRTKKKKPEDQAYHYIAFVPAGGKVWELDGFEFKPLCLGTHDEKTPFLSLATQAIQRRMTRTAGGDQALQFSLLAICHSPLDSLTEQLAKSLRCSYALDELYNNTNSSNDAEDVKVGESHENHPSGIINAKDYAEKDPAEANENGSTNVQGDVNMEGSQDTNLAVGNTDDNPAKALSEGSDIAKQNGEAEKNTEKTNEDVKMGGSQDTTLAIGNMADHPGKALPEASDKAEDNDEADKNTAKANENGSAKAKDATASESDDPIPGSLPEGEAGSPSRDTIMKDTGGSTTDSPKEQPPNDDDDDWPVPSPRTRFPPARLARISRGRPLRHEAIAALPLPADFAGRLGAAAAATDDPQDAARALAEQLRDEQGVLYARVEAAADEAGLICRDPHADVDLYGFVHTWLWVLARKGVLLDMIREVDARHRDK
ncbi:hypothetical protein F4780DRAFT_787015 [Xylariomycetidae sp. FL0641]|nr:hypothetical protein F4780DRAFT_787015 [Xylariomycetidae sp. FL0641]